jgi:iron(III) transport system substrate-binding protein
LALARNFTNMKRTFFIGLTLLIITSCGTSIKNDRVVNVYSHRHYDIDRELYENFERETGIKVNVVSSGADELIVRLKTEGENASADLLITSDASRLYRAHTEGLLQPIASEVIERQVPPHLRDHEGFWTALTVRARVIVYAPSRVVEDSLRTYADLAAPRFKKRIVARSSSNEYNQSLLASIIAHEGEDAAEQWVRGVVSNFARAPKGNDRDQVKAIAAGEGDIAFVNTYYLAKMLNSDNEAERDAAKSIKTLFPNANDRGTHINISGAGVAKYAPNKAHAIQLLEYLTRADVQSRFALANYEYPVHPDVEPADDLLQLGELRADTLSIQQLGAFNRQATELFNRGGWN